VTLRYRGHIGWNTLKIISRLISLACSLSADPNITDLLQGEYPKILARIGLGLITRGIVLLLIFEFHIHVCFYAAESKIMTVEKSLGVCNSTAFLLNV